MAILCGVGVGFCMGFRLRDVVSTIRLVLCRWLSSQTAVDMDLASSLFLLCAVCKYRILGFLQGALIRRPGR